MRHIHTGERRVVPIGPKKIYKALVRRFWRKDCHCEQLACNNQGANLFASYLSFLLFLHLLFTLMSLVLS
jgi:hypothetical protein